MDRQQIRLELELDALLAANARLDMRVLKHGTQRAKIIARQKQIDARISEIKRSLAEMVSV